MDSNAIKRMMYHRVHCTGCGEITAGDLLAFDLGAVITEAVRRKMGRSVGPDNEWAVLMRIDLCLYYTWMDLQSEFQMQSEGTSQFVFRVKELRDYLCRYSGIGSFDDLYERAIENKDDQALTRLTQKIKHPLQKIGERNQARTSNDSTTLVPVVRELINLCSERISPEEKEVIASFSVTPTLGEDDMHQPIAQQLEIKYEDDLGKGVYDVIPNKVCPFCGKSFYPEAGKYEEILIGMAGTARVGKTAYLAALINRLQEYRGNVVRMIIPANDSEWRFFNNTILSKYKNGLAIDKTPYKVNSVNIPLFSVLIKVGGHGYIFTFIDMPGETYDDDDDAEARRLVLNDRRIILHVHAFWCCFSPAQLDRQIAKYNELNIAGNQVRTDIDTVLTGLSNTLNIIHAQKKPAAVMVTRSDEIMNAEGMFSPQTKVMDEYLSGSKLIYEKLQEHINMANKYMLRVPQIETSLDSVFSGYSVFSVAAYGGNLDEPGFEMRPSMIELPFLWTLSLLGKIPTEKTLTVMKGLIFKHEEKEQEDVEAEELMIHRGGVTGWN